MAFRREAAPNSRLFILCQKGIGEREFRAAFAEFGHVEDVWIVKDKRTNEDRGIVYVSFRKTSEAMLAMEHMNGRCIPCWPKPLKIVVANNKKDGSTRDPREDEKLVRLFVVCPKSFTERDLQEHFERFGALQHVTVMRDRCTGESKGFGYIKFRRPYHAALAYEECDREMFRPKFADPQKTKDERDCKMDGVCGVAQDVALAACGGSNSGAMSMADFGSVPSCNYGTSTDMEPASSFDKGFEDGFAAFNEQYAAQTAGLQGGGEWCVSAMDEDPAPPALGGYCQLQVLTPIGMTQDYLTRLFHLVPGLQCCDLNENTGVAYARYASPQCALYARDKLHGFQYPLGSPLAVHLVDQYSLMPLHPSQHTTAQGGAQGSVDDLWDVREKAACVLERAGINPAAVLSMDGKAVTAAAALGGSDGSGAGLGERVSYCCLLLPLPQPLAPDAAPVAQRLFIVCQPSAIPECVLRDAFSRFGNLIDVFLLSGRNYGYAKYHKKASAMKAIRTLHGQILAGQRIKVLEAEPPKSAHNQHHHQPL